MNRYVVIDVGGSSIKHALMDKNGEILHKGKKVANGENINDFIEAIGEIADEYKKENIIEGLAASFPGAPNMETGIIEGGSAVPCIHGPNIVKLVQERTGLKMAMENDAKCAGLAEGWIGAAKDVKNYICVVCGTGIGGCIVIDGKLIKGRHLHTGEFGYMEVVSSDKPLGHNWSEVASTNALVTKVAAKKGLDKNSINGEWVFDNGDKDPEVKEVLDEWYRLFARGIFNLQYSIDPEKILIGGGISVRPEFIDNVNKILSTKKNEWTTLDIKVEPCKFNNDSNLIGALYNYINFYNVKTEL